MTAPVECISIAGRMLEAQYLTVDNPKDTIVLLHEALGSISHWRDFPSRLADRCQANVLVYSRLGHGNSEGPPEPRTRYYFERQALVALPAIMEHFRIQQPVLFGHSEGASMALLFAARHPGQVHALVLESPILQLEPASAKGMALAEVAWRETDLRQRLARHHRDPDAVFAAWLSIRDAEGLLVAPLEKQLPPVSMPILMLQGEHDEYGTSLQAEVLRPLAPHMEWWQLPGAGHTPHREQPDAVLARVSSFLDAFRTQVDAAAAESGNI